MTHPGTGGPEELSGEPVGDETDSQLVTISRTAALTGPDPHPELLAEVLAADRELTAVLHLVAPKVRLGLALHTVMLLLLLRAVNLRLQPGQQGEREQGDGDGPQVHGIIATFIWEIESD